MSAEKPHVLILMTDQQRADCMSGAGHAQLETPHMDRLAAEGTHFTHACTVSPLCMPARASFLCGRYVHNHDMWGNAGELAPQDESLFRRLRHAGYRTAHIGKSHYYPQGGLHMRDREPYLHARGFDDVHETTGPWATRNTDSYMTDHWNDLGLLKTFRDDYEDRRRLGHERGVPVVRPSPLPVEEFMDSYIGRQAVRFIEGYDRDEPFALFVGFGGPHEPWDPPGEYADMFDPADTPPPIDPAEPGDWVPPHAADWQRLRWGEALTADLIRRIRAAYYGKIALIDRWFGEILSACERKRVLDELLVVFWSDHGEMLGDHRMLHKSRFYESALRVPLVVRRPGGEGGGRRSAALAQTVDILPTVLEAVGLETPTGCMGKSLVPLLEDPSTTLREAAFSEVSSHGRRIVMARTDRHKYVADEHGRGLLLFDIERDPDERNNLVGHPDAKGVEAEMRERLLGFYLKSQFTMPNGFWAEGS